MTGEAFVFEQANVLDALVTRFAVPAWRGALVEAWVFSDLADRRAAEAQLAVAGVSARVRSAYKPLLHAFLDEAGLSGWRRASVGLPPEGSGAGAERFRLEAYPLAALLAPADLAFVPAAPGQAEFVYAVTLERADGSAERLEVFAPNRLRRDSFGEAHACPCGWLRVTQDGTLRQDAPLETEHEATFDAVMAWAAGQAWPADPPYFGQLEIAVETQGIERPLPFGEECVSTREALHEDLYFSLLEHFQAQAGRTRGDRGLQPGQIVPDIRAPARHGAGPTRVRIAVRQVSDPDPHVPMLAVETAGQALPLSQIEAELATLGGTPVEATSRQGRPVHGRYFAGCEPGIVLTAGQHANETSGPVGLLRALRRLREEPGLHAAAIAVENPDGYALHQQLRRANPRHMHHAARYTAFGDDLEARTAPPWHEAAARHDAVRLTRARLHINLHGYPAHEWTRPMAGYLPRGFELWTVPKGFFLILRHHPGLEDAAGRFVAALAEDLGDDPAIAALNQRQLACWRAHAGEPPFPVIRGIPCLVSPSERAATPYTLITEFPDETIYDDAFRLAHHAQMTAVLAARRIYLAQHDRMPGMVAGTCVAVDPDRVSAR